MFQQLTLHVNEYIKTIFRNDVTVGFIETLLMIHCYFRYDVIDMLQCKI